MHRKQQGWERSKLGIEVFLRAQKGVVMPNKERGRQLCCNFLVNLERSIYSGGFLLGVAAVMLTLVLSGGKELFPSEENLAAGLNAQYHLALLMNALEGEAIIFMVPLAAALPFVANYLNERKNGGVNTSLSWTDRNTYAWSKVLVYVFSGGLCVLLGYVAAVVLLLLIYSPLEKPMTMELTSYMEQMFHQGGILFLMGMLWAGLEGLLGTWYLKRHTAPGGHLRINDLAIIWYRLIGKPG